MLTELRVQFVSANWELVLGNTYSYTVLAAFGLFYLGFGFIITPSFGVADSYGGANTPEYYNALGFFMLCECCRGRDGV
jgi:succinate-acetate transporter protein